VVGIVDRDEFRLWVVHQTTGVVPVASALPTDSSLPNLVRLVGNDPTTGDYPYPFDHIDLVNNQNVMSDVFKAVSGAGETAQVTLGISPQTPTVLVDQSLSITANATNILESAGSVEVQRRDNFRYLEFAGRNLG